MLPMSPEILTDMKSLMSGTPLATTTGEIACSKDQKLAGDQNWYSWLEYEHGKEDINGHVIESIHTRCSDFVIYFCKQDGLSDLYYECTDGLLKTTAAPNAHLAKINRLVSDNEKKRRETLECVADAFEMWLCGQTKESEAILTDIILQLEVWRETRGRLSYQSAALFAAVATWALYLCNSNGGWLPPLDPWLLAAALGATGGFFSVCLNLASIKVNVNQSSSQLYIAGATRAAVALIAAVACLLAVRGKIILGLAATAEAAGAPETAIPAAVLFFLFLAGFSETFIPNVLRDSEKNAATRGSGK